LKSKIFAIRYGIASSVSLSCHLFQIINSLGFVDYVDILAVRLTQSLSNHSLRKWFVFFNAHLLIQASLIRNFALKKPPRKIRGGFVAIIELHSNQMWKDLREFYSLAGVLEKFLKIKKAGN
jgi:hypothetical protein